MDWREEFLQRLRQDYADLRFVEGRKFMYRGPRTVVFEHRKIAPKHVDSRQNIDLQCRKLEVDRAEQNLYFLQLLHEVGHAILRHCDYGLDLERLEMERAAWAEARKLCEKYGVDCDEDFVEMELDSYRDWLHRRSKCRICGLTRYQDAAGVYHCPHCETFGEG